MIIDDLTQAKLLKRYKRFLADVELEDGSQLTVHCPNPGSMKGCLVDNSKVYIKDSKNPKRKLKYTWSLIELASSLVIVDTGVANKFVKQLVTDQLIPEIAGYKYVLSEPKYLDGRFDLLLTDNVAAVEKSKTKYLAKPGDCLVEIKSTTLKESNFAMFPDAKTERGKKHLLNLAKAKAEGMRAVQLFMVNRKDTDKFRSAHEIDPAYAETLEEVNRLGVEVLAYDTDVEVKDRAEEHSFKAKVNLGTRLPVKF